MTCGSDSATKGKAAWGFLPCVLERESREPRGQASGLGGSEEFIAL